MVDQRIGNTLNTSCNHQPWIKNSWVLFTTLKTKTFLMVGPEKLLSTDQKEEKMKEWEREGESERKWERIIMNNDSDFSAHWKV